MITLKIAWRNVTRQKIRTALTVSAITLCTFSVLAMMAFAHGGHQQMIVSTVSIMTGHFQVQSEGYLDDPALDKAFEPPNGLIKALDASEQVQGVAPRIISGGLITAGDKTAGAMIVGVDPEREIQATRLIDRVQKGRTLSPGDDKSVVLGKTLAKNLDVQVGDEVQIMSQTYYGSLGLRFYEVAGLIYTGTPEFDQNIVVMPLAELQNFLEMDGLYSEISVVLHSESDKKEVMQVAKSYLDPKGSLIIVPWEELLAELVDFLFLDNAFGVLNLSILVVVVAFIVLLTITMSVMERTREFGVQIAIGSRPGRVLITIIIECFFIGLIGTALGMILGTAFTYYYSIHPYVMEQYKEIFEIFGMEPVISAKLNATMFWSCPLIMMTITLLSAIPPAVRATRIKPVDAMRHV